MAGFNGWIKVCLISKKNKKKMYYAQNNKKKLYGPFLWMEFSCRKATEPLRGDSLLFTIQFAGVPGTQLIDLGRMKGLS